jgi:hypothetical protein
MKAHLRLVAAALATSILVAVPAAYAADATGTVTCKLMVHDESDLVTYQTVAYPVELYWDGLVVDRWGTGRNIFYAYSGDFANSLSGGSRSFSLYIAKATDPENTATFERLYAEAGKIDVRVDKQRGVTLTGRSYVVMDDNFGSGSWITQDAECTWKMTGALPALP